MPTMQTAYTRIQDQAERVARHRKRAAERLAARATEASESEQPPAAMPMVDLATDVAEMAEMERIYAYAISVVLEASDREITDGDLADWNADQPATVGAAEMVRKAMTLDEKKWTALTDALGSSMVLA